MGDAAICLVIILWPQVLSLISAQSFSGTTGIPSSFGTHGRCPHNERTTLSVYSSWWPEDNLHFGRSEGDFAF